MARHWNKAELFASLPPVWLEGLRPAIRAAIATQPDHKLVVLDDDPTGTQTVHDVILCALSSMVHILVSTS